MADPTSEPGGSPRRRRRRRSKQGRKQEKDQRRRRLALVLVLLATMVGAAVFAPDFIHLIRKSQPGLRPAQRPLKNRHPVVAHNWHFDFSMGPMIELIEQGLNLQPFDLRRPLRIPFIVPSRPGGDILLASPDIYLPPLLPSYGSPLGDLPPGSGDVTPSLPPLPPVVGGGGGIPDGQPDFDPNLTVSDSTLAPSGKPPNTPGPPPHPGKGPPAAPEPGVLWLIAPALAVLARRRRPAR